MQRPMNMPAGGAPQPGGQGMPADPQQPQPRPQRQGLAMGMGNPAAGNGKGQQADPELQEQYNKFVLLSTNMIFDERLEEGAIKAMTAEGDPVRAVAKLASLVASRVYMAARKESGSQDAIRSADQSPISPAVLLHGGWEIVQQAAEFAEMNGIGQLSQEDMEMAYLMAVDQFRLTLEQSGVLDGQAMKQDMREMERLMGPEAVRAIEEAANADRIPRNALMPKGAQPPRPGAAQGQQPPAQGKAPMPQGGAPRPSPSPQRPGRGLGAAAGMA